MFHCETPNPPEQYNIDDESLTRLNTILNSILKKHKDLKQFINSVSVTNRDKYLRCLFYKRLLVDQYEVDPNEDPDLFHRPMGKNWTDTVIFTSFGIRQLQYMVQALQARDIEVITRIYRPIVPANDSIDPISDRFVNLEPTLTGITGNQINYINVVDIYNTIASSDRGSGSFSSLIECMFVGKNNILVAMVTSHGSLIIRWNIIKQLLKLKDSEKVKSLLDKILTRFTTYSKLFSEINVRDLSRKYEKSLLTHFASITKRLRRNSELSMVGSAVLVDTDHKRQRFEEWILFEVQKHLRSFKNNSVISLSRSESFKSVLHDVFQSFNRQLQQAVKDAYGHGMLISRKMLAENWELISPSEVPKKFYKESCTWWKKHIDMHPDRFILKNTTYMIPEDQRHRSHVSDIYLSSEGHAFCEGEHPNVHSGSQGICLGDLGQINLTESPEKIQDYLQKLEILLQVINFDSAYSSEILPSLEEVSKKMQVGNRRSRNVDLSEHKGVKKLVPSDFFFRPVNAQDKELKDGEDPHNVELESVELVENGESVFNGQGMAQDNISLEYDKLKILLNTMRQVFNPIEIKYTYSSKRLIWVLPNNSIIGIAEFPNDYGRQMFYIKDKYSCPRFLDFAMFNDILPFCTLKEGTFRQMNWWEWLTTDNALKFKFASKAEADDYRVRRQIEKRRNCMRNRANNRGRDEEDLFEDEEEPEEVIIEEIVEVPLMPPINTISASTSSSSSTITS